MVNQEKKSCPRCQSLFICKAGDLIRCQCYEIRLTAQESAFIEERYPDCLCRHCLEELKHGHFFFKEKFFINGGK